MRKYRHFVYTPLLRPKVGLKVSLFGSFEIESKSISISAGIFFFKLQLYLEIEAQKESKFGHEIAKT